MLNPAKLHPFVEAFRIKEERFRDHANVAAWLGGVYVGHALAAAFGKNSPYPAQPISLEEEQTEEKLEVDAIKFGAFASMFNRQFQNDNAGAE